MFRNDPATREGKYPVLLRRDGTVPEWEWFVLGARDEHAPAAIRDYADRCERFCMDPRYVADLREMADTWDRTQALEAKRRADGTFTAKPADPDGPRHRKDDPYVLTFPGTLEEFCQRMRRVGLLEALEIVAEAENVAEAERGESGSLTACGMTDLIERQIRKAMKRADEMARERGWLA